MTAYLINHLRQPDVLHRAQSGSVDRRFGSTQRERGSRPLELQYLLPDDQGSRERSRRIVAFIQIGLAEFGLQHRDA
jgi:hypothetical protein